MNVSAHGHRKHSLIFRLVTTILITAPVCWAGTGGISPTDGTYEFRNTSGSFVDRGTFSTNGGSKTLKTSINGNYKKQSQPAGASHESVCFHATQTGTPPYEYEYKRNGDVIETGTVHP